MYLRKRRIIFITILIFAVLLNIHLFSDQNHLNDNNCLCNDSVNAGPVPTMEGYSTDVPLEEQYITAIEGYRMIQHIILEDGGSDTFPIRIDSFTVTNTGWLTDYDVTGVQLWADGGNGYFDGGGSPPRADDVQIGQTIYNPTFKSGQVIGQDDGIACCTVANGESLAVFLTMDLDEGCVWNGLEIPTQIDATDLTPLSSSNWSKFQGVESSTNNTKTYGIIMIDEIAIHDTNNNGIVDELHIKTEFPLGPVQSINHKVNENYTIDKFTVKYDGDEVDIKGISLKDSDEFNTTFALKLDENDPDITLDTTPDEFTVKYLYNSGDFRYLSADGREVRLFEIKDTFLITDEAGPIVTDLTFTHETITGGNAGETFQMVLIFSEEMDTSLEPEGVFDDPIHEPPAQIVEFVDEYWIDARTLQVNFTILDVEMFAGDVDVVVSGQDTFDANGVQLSPLFVIEDAFYVDMKPPIISDFPLDELTSGQDYTVRVTVEDFSEIDWVMLDYDFGSGLNTKIMNFDPGSGKYIAVVTPPLDAANLSYRISAYDIYDNTVASSFHYLNISADEDETNETDIGENDGDSDDGEEDNSDDQNETDAADDNSTNQNETADSSDTDSQESTPGFEMLLLSIACLFFIFIVKKRM